jgi:hypothetical protein
MPTDQQLQLESTDKPEWFAQLLERLMRLNDNKRSVLDCSLDQLFTKN